MKFDSLLAVTAQTECRDYFHIFLLIFSSVGMYFIIKGQIRVCNFLNPSGLLTPRVKNNNKKNKIHSY